MIFVPDPNLTGPEEVDVSITVDPWLSGTRRHESATVQARKYQPNGPGCDPVVFAASVEANDDGLHQRP